MSRFTVYNWLKKKTKTGAVKDAVPKMMVWKKLELQALISYVREHTDSTLAEYAKRFGADSILY